MDFKQRNTVTGGAKNMIEGQLASLGANSLVVNSGKRTKSGKTVITGNVKPLTGKDVEAIGTVVGILISKLASALTGWPTQISVLAILVVFLFSALVGIVFGIYPAKKAAQLNPIEALRYE